MSPADKKSFVFHLTMKSFVLTKYEVRLIVLKSNTSYDTMIRTFTLLIALCLFVQSTIASMPGCENEPYHDESYHPVVRMLPAVPVSQSARDAMDRKVKDYASKLDSKITKGSFKKQKISKDRGNDRNLRSAQGCATVCARTTCTWCLKYDVLFGLTCRCSRRRMNEIDWLESNKEEEGRELNAVPYTSNRNCFTPLQDEACAAQLASAELSARDMKIPFVEIKCFLIPSDL